MQAWLTTFISTLVLSLSIANVSAQTLGPAMLEQLRSMPRAEQEALARQYGVDLSSITPSGELGQPGGEMIGQPGKALKQIDPQRGQTSENGLVEVTRADKS